MKFKRAKYTRYTLTEGFRKVKTKTALIFTAISLAVAGGGGLSVAMFGTAHATTPYTLFGNASQQADGVHLASLTNTGDYSGVTISLPAGTTIADLSDLEANFQVLTGHCYGGSPRYSVETAAGNIFVYMGDQPSFTTCAGGPTGNLLTASGSQIDASQLSGLGGTYGDTWSHVQSIAGSQVVTNLDIVVDSGWALPMGFNFTSATVNGTAISFVPAQLVGAVTGGLTLSNPRQQISFNAFDYGVNSSADYGTVEYQNFEYPGGLHYTASIQCATVSGTTARFVFQIPNGYPGLSGLYVLASVTDGGSPGKGHDTYGHTATADKATAMSWCESGTSVTNYSITGGNLVVHKQ